MYGRIRATRRAKALTGACLTAGALALAGAGTAHAQTPLPDTHNIPTNAVTGNVTFLDNVRGVSGYSAANFIDYGGELGDFMFGDGTGGLSIWSLKDPEQPLYVAPRRPAAPAAPSPATRRTRFYEGENPTVDSRRKLAFLARDPRSFGGTHPSGRTGLYIIDVKNPCEPEILTYHWVPAGHTATCINDCRYLWSVGPANNGSRVNGQPQDITGSSTSLPRRRPALRRGTPSGPASRGS